LKLKTTKKNRKRKVRIKVKPPQARELSPGEFVKLPGGMIVGEVSVSDLKLRRKRFRRMDFSQVAALKDSVSRLGFRDPIMVIPAKNGGYELIDGHHRLDEATAQEAEHLPAIVLTDKDGEIVSPTEADLSMLRFNYITANTEGEEYLEFIHDMSSSGVSLDDIARATAKEADAVEELVGAFTADLDSAPTLDPGSTDEAAPEDKSRYDSATPFGAAESDEVTHESSRGAAIVVPLPGTTEVRELIQYSQELFGVDTYAEAVVLALRAVSGAEIVDEGDNNE